MLIGILLPYKKDIADLIARKLYKKETKSGTIELAIEQSYRLANSKQNLIRGQVGLIEDLKNYYIYDRRHARLTDLNYHQSFLIAGIAYYSEYTGQRREATLNLIDKYLSKKGALLNNLKIVDEVPFGLACVSAFRWTNEPKYQTASNEIFKFCLSKQTESDGILYRDNAKWNYVDSLAMTVPFLMEFGTTFNEPKAIEMAENNLLIYSRFGVDKQTGVPSQAYSIESKLKLGSINWGRGIGWYLLAASFVPNFDDSLLNESISKMTYTQFVGGTLDDIFDSTTALLFEFYKKKKMGQSNGLDFIKPYIDANGNIMNVSGDTFWLNRFANRYGKNKLGNALFMLLLSRYIKDNKYCIL